MEAQLVRVPSLSGIDDEIAVGRLFDRTPGGEQEIWTRSTGFAAGRHNQPSIRRLFSRLSAIALPKLANVGT
jgi:hypothetical protein